MATPRRHSCGAPSRSQSRHRLLRPRLGHRVVLPRGVRPDGRSNSARHGRAGACSGLHGMGNIDPAQATGHKRVSDAVPRGSRMNGDSLKSMAVLAALFGARRGPRACCDVRRGPSRHPGCPRARCLAGCAGNRRARRRGARPTRAPFHNVCVAVGSTRGGAVPPAAHAVAPEKGRPFPAPAL